MNPFLMRRKEFMTNQQHIQKLEYIQSTGTQYIDTLYKPNPKTVLEMDIQFVENKFSNTAFGKYASFIGITEDVASFSANFGSNASQYNEIYYWNNTAYLSPGTVLMFQKYLNIYDRSIMLIKNNSVDFLGITKELTPKTTSNTVSCILFGTRNITKQIIYPLERHDMKLYGFKIYEDETLIKDFIPAMYGEKVGLYDQVEKKFYENIGTGEFLYG